MESSKMMIDNLRNNPRFFAQIDATLRKSVVERILNTVSEAEFAETVVLLMSMGIPIDLTGFVKKEEEPAKPTEAIVEARPVKAEKSIPKQGVMTLPIRDL
jgi:hypothetical protein